MESAVLGWFPDPAMSHGPSSLLLGLLSTLLLHLEHTRKEVSGLQEGYLMDHPAMSMLFAHRLRQATMGLEASSSE